MTPAETYLAALRLALNAEGNAALAHAGGAPQSQLDVLRAVYPHAPATLVDLLRRLNGTYHQTYGDTRIGVMVLGSDVGSYPYYLLSVDQIVEEAAEGFGRESIADIYDLAEFAPGELFDPRIDATVPMGRRLCFSHCMNNGGSSRLYIDFDPAPDGKPGQVIRYLHDPDSYAVLADDFDRYLAQLVADGLPFLEDQDELELHWQAPARNGG
ncbi:SMI1/KNR4 family protein [Burkholderia sp. Ac-20379]|uniref:SMI1/KNR4 family protein n=1 Tax=Burkholderia sp. Ac-20379 TaxID=2703900 RepID=UPI0019806E09|nr:SMI1/KNR4 family protein [Burkholderia sp. Ac-20379]MBN3727502.1 SMI1/KNR4 family protein [Burkholderia sp. Ac-20379]